MKRKAKISEIKLWYKFRPSLYMWFTKMNNRTFIIPLLDETWYDGYLFKKGYFVLIQMKYIAIHIKFVWWKLDLYDRKNRK